MVAERWMVRRSLALAVFFDQAFRFERVDDAGHRRWTDLLGVGEVAEGDGAAKDDDREG